MSRSLITRLKKLEAAVNAGVPRIHLWLNWHGRDAESGVVAADLGGAWISRNRNEPLDDFKARAIKGAHGDTPPAIVVGIFLYESTDHHKEQGS